MGASFQILCHLVFTKHPIIQGCTLVKNDRFLKQKHAKINKNVMKTCGEVEVHTLELDGGQW